MTAHPSYHYEFPFRYGQKVYRDNLPLRLGLWMRDFETYMNSSVLMLRKISSHNPSKY